MLAKLQGSKKSLTRPFRQSLLPDNRNALPKGPLPRKLHLKKARVKKTKEQKKQEIAQRVKAKTAQLDEAVDQKAREGSQLGFFTAKFKEAPSVTFVNEDGDSETISLDVNTTEADDAKILELMQENIPAQQSKKKGTETTERAEARAAQTYFNKQENPNDAVEVIAHEVSFADGQFRAASDMSDGERAYFAGTGKDRAKMALRWIRKNLSPETNKQVDKMLELHRQSLADSLRKEDTNIDHVETSRKLQKKADLEAAISAKKGLKIARLHSKTMLVLPRWMISTSCLTICARTLL